MLGRLKAKQTPSLKTGWVRKLTSRCVDYQMDFQLFCLLHDIALARQISSLVSVAKEKNIAPDEAANGMQNFSAFWSKEQQKLEDTKDTRGKASDGKSPSGAERSGRRRERSGGTRAER